jgi:hypothetical protein
MYFFKKTSCFVIKHTGLRQTSIESRTFVRTKDIYCNICKYVIMETQG